MSTGATSAAWSRITVIASKSRYRSVAGSSPASVGAWCRPPAARPARAGGGRRGRHRPRAPRPASAPIARTSTAGPLRRMAGRDQRLLVAVAVQHHAGPASAARATSAASHVLPIPGSPTTNASCRSPRRRPLPEQAQPGQLLGAIDERRRAIGLKRRRQRQRSRRGIPSHRAGRHRLGQPLQLDRLEIAELDATARADQGTHEVRCDDLPARGSVAESLGHDDRRTEVIVLVAYRLARRAGRPARRAAPARLADCADPRPAACPPRTAPRRLHSGTQP